MVSIRAVEINTRTADEQQAEQDADHERNNQAAAFRQGRENHVVGRIGQRSRGIAAERVGVEQRLARLQDLIACALRVDTWVKPDSKTIDNLIDLVQDKLHRAEIAGAAGQI